MQKREIPASDWIESEENTLQMDGNTTFNGFKSTEHKVNEREEKA